MYCRNCGKEIDDNADVCIYCGRSQKDNRIEDNGGCGWTLLGLCIPLVGFILYLVWRDEKPKTARAVGLGALINILFAVFFYFIIFVIGIGAAFI